MVPVAGLEFESEDMHTTVTADMLCWKVSADFVDKSRPNGGVVSRRCTSLIEKDLSLTNMVP